MIEGVEGCIVKGELFGICRAVQQHAVECSSAYLHVLAQRRFEEREPQVADLPPVHVW